MYPATYFSFFPPFPQTTSVFVAMSFAPQFTKRWEEVIQPAIKRIATNDKRWTPLRVDHRQISDSILTEILDGISQSCLFFADITTQAIVDGQPYRNSNVMYEVGLAHAVRTPPEVILFRSDNDQLPFDVTNIRVNSYAPDSDPSAASDQLGKALFDAVREIDHLRSRTVVSVASTLDVPSMKLLFEVGMGPVNYPNLRTFGDVLGNVHKGQAFTRLLELGAIKVRYAKMTAEILKKLEGTDEGICEYHITPLGQAVMNYCISQFGLKELNQNELPS